jgi:hypothetical protein
MPVIVTEPTPAGNKRAGGLQFFTTAKRDLRIVTGAVDIL